MRSVETLLGDIVARFCAGFLALGLVGITVADEPVRLLVTGARLFTMAETQPEGFEGYFLVGTDGRIEELGAGEPANEWPDAEILDLAGDWVLPGFVSAHSHLWQSAWRGLAADQTLMGWVDALYLEQARFAEEEDYYWFTLQGALDHIRYGITAAYNFNYGGWGEPAYAEAQLRGELDSGIRFVHGQNFGGWGQVPTVEEGIAEAGDFLRWVEAQETGDQLLAVMINGSAGFRDTPAAAITEAAIGEEFKIGNQIHYLESAPEQFEEQARFRWMVDADLITNRLVVGHFIHVDPWILGQVTAAGASMAWNPLSNGRLASGTPDIPKYLEAGLRIGMGVDGQASADRADPWANVRTGLYAVRALHADASVLSPYQVLRMHTWGSADALGVADRVGSLEVGKFADFLVVDPSDFGVVFDDYATLAFVAGPEHMRSVYIGGKLHAQDGQLVEHDYVAVSNEVNQRVQRVRESQGGK